MNPNVPDSTHRFVYISYIICGIFTFAFSLISAIIAGTMIKTIILNRDKSGRNNSIWIVSLIFNIVDFVGLLFGTILSLLSLVIQYSQAVIYLLSFVISLGLTISLPSAIVSLTLFKKYKGITGACEYESINKK
ncbi:MAG: hypothetical protein MJ223_00045 [Mycoplasmoidaceae bacterium]|nr:hypothetical protein [Mycoplasmoidaceae bacterium]